ncbi:RNase H family protein [Longimicrobium terrae]|uniref:ribonuclease H n=1 Tax=Longimicrobium terrae TaxID=1639882 RepID=A0A841H6G4_9BACT|nr:ribonuclease HI [Longimicrobium terrae]MBB6073446.1 ribonuclease HI [Longimicrobium terrae]NNC32566.1 ribonuclease HI [Longimicrobium terrae]
MPEQPPLVFVYADESCLGNQYKDRARPGGAAGLMEYWHPEKGWVRRDFYLAEPDTTNNRMAIRSATVPLQSLKQASRVVFTSDSRYLVDGMTSWVHGWAARGWVRKGGEIENLELWKALMPVAARHEVQWRWVKGHNGHAQNEYANFLATRSAAKQMDSGGLVESGFDAWLREEQAKERCRNFFPVPPDKFEFKPGRRAPTR